MILKQAIFTCFFFCCITNVFSQKDSIEVKFSEIHLAISKVKDFSKGYSVSSISDTLVVRDIKSLTNILRFNSFIYFKEEGLGMVSSPSFRGTNSSQTAVLWNGININSQLLGQVDFNALSSNSYDDITVRSGGGSVLFGSGAIGGTVHLDNTIDFTTQTKHNFIGNYGSFNTKHISYQFKKATDKTHINIGLGYNASENDYKYLKSNLFNENGSFSNFNADVNFGYQFSTKSNIKLFANAFAADRNLSRTLNAPSNDSYEDFTLRNLLEWNYKLSTKELLSTKLAYLFDQFTFFDNNNNRALFSRGNTKRTLSKIDYNNFISKKIQLNGVLEFENTAAIGSTFQRQNRTIFTTILSLNHQLFKKLSYGAQFRKDYIKDFNSPFLYSLGLEYKFNSTYTLSVNTSKNFRIPTFNDLYWTPGGNPDLESENAYQFELGNKLHFKNKSFQFNTFYIKTSNLIQWLPNDSGIWSPINVNETENYGLEVSYNHKFNYGLHLFQFNINYSYTIAKNLETNKQLFLVPKHRANFLIDYNYKKITVFYQQLFNDEVSFLVDTIPYFTVANIGINYQIQSLKNQPTVGFKINNIYNTYYQNTLNRPMPGINFQITTNINF
ncbi:TonB-dependent receptor [Polaribacter sp. WD7]|uniref:TonB-dependent receptor plug domain-containing protein n=1 Tax=Polaribacter sp. WD7 TaxID=2269061 RepID=UPI000DF1EAB9|nr:TonB-dependent receptor [Polaribacter sp. WD7]RCS26863.1 TonB-dependent receptor [Polaribacter sp. WD7]